MRDLHGRDGEEDVLRGHQGGDVLRDVVAEPLRQREDAGVAAEQVGALESDPYLTATAPPQWWQRS